MNVHINPTQGVTLHLPDHLSAALNLDDMPEIGLYDAEELQEKRGHKVTALLTAARNLAAANFPLLTQNEWMLLLNVIQVTHMPYQWEIWNLALQPTRKSFLSNEIYQSYGKEIVDGLDMSRLDRLGPSETLSILLVADRFWTRPTGQCVDLRELLSAVSKRPKESVYCDDPTIEDLWEAKSIEFACETEGKVTFTYADQEMATLEFTLSSDKNTVSFGAMTCKETRPLVAPADYLPSFLSRIAAKSVFATVQ